MGLDRDDIAARVANARSRGDGGAEQSNHHLSFGLKRSPATVLSMRPDLLVDEPTSNLD
jgi:energy-coupling factor transporter ATP-binding protein EcfA2